MSAHGIMCHHFHREGEPAAQGSITADIFARMIEFIGRKRFLPAAEWYERAINDGLNEDDLCLTFDDNLMCQYDIARPVMEDFGLTGFFFIYSSVSEGNLENLEIYRVLRTDHFSHVNDFYAAFEKEAQTLLPEIKLAEKLSSFRAKDYLTAFPFYSDEDRRFRYIRDEILGNAQYCHVMDALITSMKLSKEKLAKNLWMDNARLKALSDKGHMIGLHSYSHPTRMCEFTPTVQADEYHRNYEHIKKATGIAPLSMSHPCNSYTPDTLALLDSMGVKLGFCANMAPVANRSYLEFPREDHANIVRKMKS